MHGQVALYRASGHEDEEKSARVGRLSFVDLAGSERANRTGNVGARLKYAPCSQSCHLHYVCCHAPPLVAILFHFCPSPSHAQSLFPPVSLLRIEGHADQDLQMCFLQGLFMVPDSEQVKSDTKAGLCRESVAINASLMTLGRCLEALRWNQQHRAAEPKLVPYRESKASPFTSSCNACLLAPEPSILK